MPLQIQGGGPALDRGSRGGQHPRTPAHLHGPAPCRGACDLARAFRSCAARNNPMLRTAASRDGTLGSSASKMTVIETKQSRTQSRRYRKKGNGTKTPETFSVPSGHLRTGVLTAHLQTSMRKPTASWVCPAGRRACGARLRGSAAREGEGTPAEGPGQVGVQLSAGRGTAGRNPRPEGLPAFTFTTGPDPLGEAGAGAHPRRVQVNWHLRLSRPRPRP